VEPVIVLYAKAGCHLCDDARTHLDDLAADYHFTFDEVDIRRDPAIFERYRYRIPVIPSMALNDSKAASRPMRFTRWLMSFSFATGDTSTLTSTGSDRYTVASHRHRTLFSRRIREMEMGGSAACIRASESYERG